MIKNKIVKNASWIIGVKIFQAILGLIISMLTARYLGPSGFGVISYAASVVAFVVPIMQLGMSNILVKEMVDDPLHEGEILGTALVLNLISSISCVIGVTCFASVANRGEQETIIVCALYSITLVAQASEILIYWFQAKLLSKYTSIISLVAYFIVSLYKVFLLATNKSVFWFAISQSIDFAIIAIALFVTYKKLGGTKLSFSGKRAKLLFSQSRHYIISSMMVTVFAQTDRIMLKLMIDDAATGYYSAAALCCALAAPPTDKDRNICKIVVYTLCIMLFAYRLTMNLTSFIPYSTFF